jgi:hypothetical protein
MKPIHLSEKCDDGYVEVEILNLSCARWAHYKPDRRKLQYKRTIKYCRLSFGVGDPQYIGKFIWGSNNKYKNWFKLTDHLLQEGIRRWKQRYSNFGKLSDALPSPDPLMHSLFETIQEQVNNSSIYMNLLPD